MKKISFFIIALLASMSLFSQDISLISPSGREIATSMEDLINQVNVELEKHGATETVQSITRIDYMETGSTTTAIIEYTPTEGAETNIAFKLSYDKESMLQQKVSITCSGTCNNNRCRLQGEISNEDPKHNYIQCSCSGCKMNVVITKFDESYDFGKIVAWSYKETFGQVGTNLTVDRVEDYSTESATVFIYNYKDEEARNSTLMIVISWEDQFAVGEFAFEKKSSYVVDCTGTCDCRERFYPSNGAIECTCDKCKMTIKKATSLMQEI